MHQQFSAHLYFKQKDHSVKTLLTIIAKAVTLAIVLMLLVDPKLALGRTWTASDGRTVEAEYVGMKDGKFVLLKKSNNKVYSVPLDRLSEVDQAYVQSQAIAPMAATKPVDPKQVSAIEMIENWEIVSGGVPFFCKPGASFPQEVFDARVREEYKWIIAKGKIEAPARLAGVKAIVAFSKAEYGAQARTKFNVLQAFVAALSKEQHLQFAKSEAQRPQEYFDDRVRKAFDWVRQFQQLTEQERIARWEEVVAIPEKQLAAEVLARYRSVLPDSPK